MSAGTAGISFQIEARNQANAALRQLTDDLRAARESGNATAKELANLAQQLARTGDAANRLSAVTSEVDKAGKAASSAAGQQGGSTGFFGMAGAMGAGIVAAQALMGAVSGVTGAVTDSIQAAFQYNSTIAAQTTAYEHLTGSAEQGKQSVEELVNFANRTPFDSKTVLDFGQKLLFAGQSAESLIPTMEAVGNIAAASGKMTSENMSRVALALSQVATAGRLQGDELNQLADAGVPALQAVMEAYGLTSQEAIKLKEQGGISSEMLISALRKMGLESTKFAGTMSGQMDQPLGALEALKSNLEAARADALEPLTDELGNLVVGLAKFSQSKDFQGFIAGMTAAFKELITIVKDGIAPALKQGFSVEQIRGFAEGALTLLRNFIVGVDYVGRQIGTFAQTTGRQFNDLVTIVAAMAQSAGQALGGLGQAMERVNKGDFKGAANAIAEAMDRQRTAVGFAKTAFDDLGKSLEDHAKASRVNAQSAAEDGMRIGTAFTTAFDEVKTAADDTKKSVAGDLAEIADPKVDPAKLKKFSDDLIQAAKDQRQAHADAARDIADIEAKLDADLEAKQAKRAEQLKDLMAQEKQLREQLADALEELDEKRAGQKAEYEGSYNDLVIQYSAAQTQEQRDAITKQISAIQDKERAAEASFKRQGQYGQQYADLISQLQRAETEEQRDAIAEQINQLERKERKEKDTYDKAAMQERQQTVNKQVEADLRIREVNREADLAIVAANREADARIAKVKEREQAEIDKSAEKRDKLIEDNKAIVQYVDLTTGAIDRTGQAIITAADRMKDLKRATEDAARAASGLKIPAGSGGTAGAPDMTTDNVPHFAAGGLTGGYQGPAEVHSNEAIMPLSALQPMMDDAVKAALAKYLQFAKQEGDYLNDWLSHLPEVMKKSALVEGLRLSGADPSKVPAWVTEKYGVGGPPPVQFKDVGAGPVAPVPVVGATGPGLTAVNYGPTETEASKAYRKQLDDEAAAAAKAKADADKEAERASKELADSLVKAAQEADRLAEQQHKSQTSYVQETLGGMRDKKYGGVYETNLRNILGRYGAGQIDEATAKRQVQGIFGSYEDASGITKKRKAATDEAAMEEALRGLLGADFIAGKTAKVEFDYDKVGAAVARAVAAQPITVNVDGVKIGEIARQYSLLYNQRNDRRSI